MGGKIQGEGRRRRRAEADRYEIRAVAVSLSLTSERASERQLQTPLSPLAPFPSTDRHCYRTDGSTAFLRGCRRRVCDERGSIATAARGFMVSVFFLARRQRNKKTRGGTDESFDRLSPTLHAPLSTRTRRRRLVGTNAHPTVVAGTAGTVLKRRKLRFSLRAFFWKPRERRRR